MLYSRRRVVGAKAVIGWTLLLFTGVQLALDVFVVPNHPELRDPEYGARLATLRERIAEEPNRPLCLMLGSSRVVGSFVPEKLPPVVAASGERPLVFNFSHLGAGPGMNLLEARRLLRDGIRPKWVVLEVMPPQLGDDSQSILLDTASARDLSFTRRYRHPVKVYGSFARSQLVPSYRYRRFMARHAVPGWIADEDWRKDAFPVGPLGGDLSQQSLGKDFDRVMTVYCTEMARKGYQPELQKLRVVELSDKATHEILHLFRRRGIEVALVLTPESATFQGWYSPESRRRVDEYIAAIGREYRVPVIDGRNWLADDEFTDGHHVNARGAEAFTLRLGREVIEPLVNGKLKRPE